MKKTIALILCIVLSLAVFTACSGSSTDSKANDTGTNSQSAADSLPAEFKIGDTWTVDGQWELTVTGFEETSDRNEYSDKKPGAVYIVSYTYKNIGYDDASGVMDGLYISLDDSIIDCEGTMGYSYPGEVTDYPQSTPVGATCKAQVCIGVDNAGTPFKLNVSQYDSNSKEQKATFVIG